MNERIRELAELAGFGPRWFEKSEPGHPSLPRGMVRDFAQLIVNDVLDILYEDSTASFSLENKIKRHFGVEE